MKHRMALSLGMLLLGLACAITSGGAAGATVDNLLADPYAGLDGLHDYQAGLTISTPGTGSSAPTETYTQSAWPALDAGFVTYEGVDGNNRPLFVLSGDVGEAHYSRVGESGDCAVQWGADAKVEGAQPVRLASFLPPVNSAKTAGEETVAGISTKHYTFDAESIGLAKDAKAAGEVWIAEQGGYVVKYVLQMEGGGSASGGGTQAARRMEYLLSQVGTRPQVEYPDGCRPVLTDIPAMDDAVDIIRLPGMLDYSSNSTLESITAFYVDYFTSGEWTQVGETLPDENRAVELFSRGASEDIALVVVRREADVRRVTVSLFTEETAAAATPGPEVSPEAGGESSPMVRVADGLNILLGMDASHPAPASFHMEAFHNAPGWEAGGVIHIQDRMTADVQGENIHFVDRETAPDGTVTETECYLMGDLEYDVENGVLQPPGAGMKKLAWALWPLDPIAILGTGAGSAKSAGTEALDGRTAEIYDIDAGGGTLGGVAGVSLNITAVKGRVWIDRETGALVKAELDYRADVKDADGKVMENADGRLEIAVTNIGKVTVTLPAQ